MHVTNIHLSRTSCSLKATNVSIFMSVRLDKVAHGNPHMSAGSEMDVIHVTNNAKLRISTISFNSIHGLIQLENYQNKNLVRFKVHQSV